MRKVKLQQRKATTCTITDVFPNPAHRSWHFRRRKSKNLARLRKDKRPLRGLFETNHLSSFIFHTEKTDLPSLSESLKNFDDDYTRDYYCVCCHANTARGEQEVTNKDCYTCAVLPFAVSSCNIIRSWKSFSKYFLRCHFSSFQNLGRGGGRRTEEVWRKKARLINYYCLNC